MIVATELAGFTDDGKAALAASPGYFLAWYTAKSLALCGALVGLAYLAGRSAGRRRRA